MRKVLTVAEVALWVCILAMVAGLVMRGIDNRQDWSDAGCEARSYADNVQSH